ncbi:MAG: hypothetical protein AAF236_02290, partial [Verrucomicrobiota bacterium]
QLAEALNNSASSASGSVIPSGIDYSTTVWAAGSSGGVDYVRVVSGPIPATLDLVSVPASIPVSAI